MSEFVKNVFACFGNVFEYDRATDGPFCGYVNTALQVGSLVALAVLVVVGIPVLLHSLYRGARDSLPDDIAPPEACAEAPGKIGGGQTYRIPQPPPASFERASLPAPPPARQIPDADLPRPSPVPTPILYDSDTVGSGPQPISGAMSQTKVVLSRPCDACARSSEPWLCMHAEPFEVCAHTLVPLSEKCGEDTQVLSELCRVSDVPARAGGEKRPHDKGAKEDVQPPKSVRKTGRAAGTKRRHSADLLFCKADDSPPSSLPSDRKRAKKS